MGSAALYQAKDKSPVVKNDVEPDPIKTELGKYFDISYTSGYAYEKPGDGDFHVYFIINPKNLFGSNINSHFVKPNVCLS